MEIFDAKPTYSYPIPNVDHHDNTFGYEIWTSQLDGIYSTLWFGGKTRCNETMHNLHFILQFPLNVYDEADGAVLDIEMKAHNDEDWQVLYRRGAKYVLYKNPRKDWHEAENDCVGKNGHLASVSSRMELIEIDAALIKSETWIGGTDMEVEDLWTWSDGRPWPERSCTSVIQENDPKGTPCIHWGPGYPKGGQADNCAALFNGIFKSGMCANKRDYICRLNQNEIVGNKSLSFALDKVDFSKIELWLKRKSTNCDATKSMPGFSLKWSTKVGNGTTKGERFDVSKVLAKVVGAKKPEVTGMRSYWKIISKNIRYSIVLASRRYNMTNTEIWDITKHWKREAIRKQLFTCVSNIMSPDYFSQLFNKDFRNMIYSDRPKISYKETKEDLLLAFDIFSYMTFCQNDAMELQIGVFDISISHIDDRYIDTF